MGVGERKIALKKENECLFPPGLARTGRAGTE